MDVADRLIKGELAAAMGRRPRAAAWISPAGHAHNLAPALGASHHHWIMTPANHGTIAQHLVSLADGRIDADATKLSMMRSGWIRKMRPAAYEIFEPHLERAVGTIRRHVSSEHGDLKAVQLDVLGNDGGALGDPVTVTVAPGPVPRRQPAATDVAQIRALPMSKNWDAYGSDQGQGAHQAARAARSGRQGTPHGLDGSGGRQRARNEDEDVPTKGIPHSRISNDVPEGLVQVVDVGRFLTTAECRAAARHPAAARLQTQGIRTILSDDPDLVHFTIARAG